MGDHDDGVSFLVQFLEKAEDLPAGAGVQGAGRFVREKDGGVPGQGSGDGNSLLLAAGKLVRPVLALVLKAHPLQLLHRPLPPLRRGDSRVEERQLHIFQDGKFRQEVILLENKADHPVAYVRQFVLSHIAHVLAPQQILPAGGDVQGPDDVHEGGLSGAGLPHDGHELPHPDHEVDAVVRFYDFLAHHVGLADVLHLDQDFARFPAHSLDFRHYLLFPPPLLPPFLLPPPLPPWPPAPGMPPMPPPPGMPFLPVQVFTVLSWT